MAKSAHAEDDPKQEPMSDETPAAVASVTPKASPALPVVITSVIPSFAAASELLSAPYSCLVVNTHRRHIALPPKYLNKKRSGITEELRGELLRFSESLRGVPLAYDSIKIVKQYGDIYDDSGYIHLDVEANFVIFKPKRGQRLVGQVNKLSVGHVGCLVHGCFNACIPKPRPVTQDIWRVAGPQVGSELEFEVTALDADGMGVLLIKGRMDYTRVQELLAMGEMQSSVPDDQLQEPDGKLDPDPIQEPPDSSPKKEKKKKKKKDKVKEEEVEEEVNINAAPVENGSTCEMNGSEAVETKAKKKKKKREKEAKEEVEEVAIASMEIQCSDSSGYLSDKPSKKRKRSDNPLDATLDADNDQKPPKLRKKRKSDVNNGV